MIWSRRAWLIAASALAGCSPRQRATGCASLAGETIRWIVPFSDGGSQEIYSRLIEPFFEKSLGAEVIIVTEPGNGGIVGATKLRDAPPDGHTVGIMNAPGVLGAAFTGLDKSLNPARDFSVLGRLGRSRPVVAVAASSRLKTMADLIDSQKTRPLLCGVSGIGSNSLLILSVCEAVLGLRLDYVAGLSGSRDSMLSVLRGDTDLIASNLDSVQQLVDQGELRVMLQIADGPINDEPALSNVAWLGGPEGWAARRASELGRDRDSAMSDARALIDFAGAGIIVSAPKGLPDELLECLRVRLHDAASSSGFQSAARGARRTPEVATGERAQADLSAAEQYVTRFAPIVGSAFRRARK